MNEDSYRRELIRALEMAKAEPQRADYWLGYRRGIGRGFYGERFGTATEHSVWLAFTDSRATFHVERGRGYRDGLAFARATPGERAGLLAEVAIRTAKRG